MNENHQLLNYLNQSKTMNFRDLLFSFIDRSGEKDSDVYNRAGIDRRLFSKIRCSESYTLKKENILKLCVSLKLDLTDTNELLESAGYSLSTTNDFDLILRFCLLNNIYDMETINEYLFSYTNTVLC